MSENRNGRNECIFVVAVIYISAYVLSRISNAIVANLLTAADMPQYSEYSVYMAQYRKYLIIWAIMIGVQYILAYRFPRHMRSMLSDSGFSVAIADFTADVFGTYLFLSPICCIAVTTIRVLMSRTWT
jgi:hypothetical protein